METDNKSKKRKFLDALLEGLIELLLTLVFFAIGVAVLAVFGVAPDAENVDFDLVILVGIVVFFAIVGIISHIKSRRKKKKASHDSEEL